MLASNGTTINDGKVTSLGIKNAINDVYLEVLFPRISQKFPKDFEQFTYPINTNIGTATVSASSTNTTIITTTNVFSNSMEGFQLYNVTDDEYTTIVTYTAANEVVVEDDLDDTWDGDTIYILGNEFTFGNETTDIKEVSGVYIKYKSTDADFLEVTRTDDKMARFQQKYYNTATPNFYYTSVDISSVTYPAVGILPFPTNYNGKIMFSYIEKPASLSVDADVPALKATGLHQVIINGVTAWGKRIQGKYDEATQYEELDPRTREVLPKGTLGMIASYRPITRSGARTLKLSPFIASQGRY